MTIDSSIALGVKPVQIDSPMNALAQMYQVKAAQSQGQMADMTMQKEQRGVDDSNKLRSLFSAPGFDMQNADSLKQVMAISPTQGMAMQKAQLDGRKTQVDIDKTAFDTASKSHAIYQNTMGALAYSPNLSKDSVIQAGQGLVQAGILKPEMLTASIKSMPDDPAALKAKLLEGVHAQMTPEQLVSLFAPKPTQISNGQQVGFRDTNPNSPTYGQATGGALVQLLQSPESKSTERSAAAGRAQSAQQFAATQAASKVPAGYRANPDGSMAFIPGGPADPAAGGGKPPTEFQGKSAAFGARAEQADKLITQLQGTYSPAAINAKQTVENTWLVGGALGAASNKFSLSSNDQKAEQAQRDFINAVLRQESGAAIGASEFENAAKQYFPQPGDKPENIAQKAAARKLSVQGLLNNAGRAAFHAPTDGPAALPAGPSAGSVQNGYRFKGGDAGDKANWEKL